jgi:cell division septum initiation protein DivIVA
MGCREELGAIRQLQIEGMVADQKEPVATPGDVAAESADPGNIYWNRRTITVAQHIPHSDGAIRSELYLDLSDRRFDAVPALTYPAEVSQRANDADGAVAAHTEVADVIEEDHARGARWVHRLAQQSADNNLRSARLCSYSQTKTIMIGAEDFHAFGQAAHAQIRATLYNYAGGLAHSVRVQNPHATYLF